MNDKVTAEHLNRKAVVYVRQSTPDQVRNNKESQRQQYSLADRAREMGWRQVETIDEDLGRSGASSYGRTGFLRLVAEVSMKQVGGVFSLEASRLARNNRDWYQLIDLCTLTGTLIADHDGVYDPRVLNDRLLLGLKGTMSEFELGLIRQRSVEAQKAMVKRGELYTTLPVGYVRTRDNRCEKDPDLRIQDAIEVVFEKFREYGSVRQVLLWFRHERVCLPSLGSGHDPKRVDWRLPVYNTILKLLQNPIYAGVYAYGRTVTRATVVDGHTVKTRGHRRLMEEWEALIQNHHEGYISWEEYKRNQQQVRENAAMKSSMTRGPSMSGKSLLAGLLRCKRCGRKLHVSYSGARGNVPRYSCRGAAINHGEGRCISFGGLAIDRGVEKEVLRVVQPGAVEAALKAIDAAETTEDARRRSACLALEQAEYEAARAFRQYDAVDPENRLVASELERRWNRALTEVTRLESELGSLPAEPKGLTPDERTLLLSLSEDFSRVWNDRSTDMRLRKRLVRTLVEEIVVDVDEGSALVNMVIRWAGGCHTAVKVKKNRTGKHRYSTDCEVTELVRHLAKVSGDANIARILNRLEVKTGKSNPWTESRVRSFRCFHQIPVYSQQREGARQRLNMAQAASRLGISAMSVHRLIREGTIQAEQVVPHAPWVINVSELDKPKVEAAVQAVKSGRRSPLPADPDQPKLVLPGM